ncbi:MAG: YdcF family protein [Firmicutes bacterium]|nr:YdcF family protein [Bacillota bacterium]
MKKSLPFFVSAGILLVGAVILLPTIYSFLSVLFVPLAALLLAHGIISPLKPGKLRKSLLLTLHGLLILAALALVIGEIPVLQNARTDADPKADYLIVLGAKVNGDQPSFALENRLETALDYLNTYPDARAVLSGGQGADENISEAEAMRVWLEAKGVEAARLILEPKSTSTKENLKNSLALIPAGNSIAVCSNDFHLYRAKAYAAQLGAEAKGVAAHTPLFLLNVVSYLRESCCAWALWLLGS